MGVARVAWWSGGAMGGEGGQAVVEATFALPLTVVLILCTIQITQLQRARLLLEYAAFNAARAGAVQNGNDGKDGTAGPMHDAAALSLASTQGPTDGVEALARTWAAFRLREAALRALGLPLFQVLVLGAIFGLVLMLCVLSTVNLGRAVYAKVQLQTAADAAAYSQAAVEARVLNFTAYTNRAMVVHYASIMAAAAYLAWVHFLWAAIDPAL